MKKFILPLLVVLLSFTTKLSAQCGQENQETFITTQAQLEELVDCTVFSGDLTITGADITSLDPLSSMMIVQGDLTIYETSITSVAALESLMNAYVIKIHNNALLQACCAVLDWQSALDFGTIQSVVIVDNSEGCNSFADAQASCLGLVPGCMDENAVNYNAEATFDDGTCLNGPDLQVSVSTILNSLQINTFTSTDECLVAEGCITGTGERSTLRFTTTISNYGNEDFYIGESGGPGNMNPNFYWDDCHGHAHYEGYANYQIYSYPDLQLMPLFGHKNGWCVMDLGGAVASEAPEGANYPSCTFTYGCSIMGISAGCSDTYSSGISCQWLDITTLQDGEYVLAVSTNKETDNYTPQYEIDYSNNTKYILFSFEGSSILSASEFDGSSITDVCSIDTTITSTGFNFPDDLTQSETGVELSTAYLFEYYTQSAQLFIPELYNLNGTMVTVDSMQINQVTGLPVGLEWACSTESCVYPQGYGCGGVTGISEQSGSYALEFESTLYFTDDQGNAQAIDLPYTGGNTYVDGLIGSDNFSFPEFTPSMNLTVDIPVYGCMDTVAINFNPDATFEDGSCESYNYGCTDPFALNFDEEANTEDGSCDYCAEGIEWVAQIDLMDSYGDGWNGNYYYIINQWGDTTATGTLASGSAETQLFCLMPGCYIVSVPSEGGWPYEVSWEISSAGFPDVFVEGECPDVQPLNFLEEGCDLSFGCMDTLALNYDSLAIYDDSNCEYPVFGCTDSLATNYNAAATDEDGSCDYPIVCDSTTESFVLYLHDTYGDGWNGNNFLVSNSNDETYLDTTMVSGSESVVSFCLTDGCYLITVDGGTWQQEISWEIVNATGDTVLSAGAPFQDHFAVNTVCIVNGCTDPEALNYDELADTDDGSCEYPFGCAEGYNPVVMNLQTDPYPAETSWDLITEMGDTLIAVGGFTEQNTLYSDSICVPNDLTINLNIYDTYGDGLTSGSGNGIFHFYVCGVQVFSGSDFEHLYAAEFTGCEGASIIVFGCTDSLANNYDSGANTDDGTCEYDVILGCTDSTAVNYNELATDDDGSCEYMNCEFYEVLVELNMFSTTGNGWEAVNYAIEQLGGDMTYTGTLEDGFEGADYLCMMDGCYIITVPEYTGGDTKNWSILYDGKKLISGATGVKDIFGVNQECTLVQGCTDELAYNYNPQANHDDGSCTYLNTGSQTLALNEGWNMVSTYVQQSNMDMEAIISALGLEVVIVKNGLGLAYLPDWNFNGIGDWNNTEGYQIKMLSNQSLSFNGNILLPEETPIELTDGWNMISYLRDSDAATDAVFENMVDHVVIVKDAMGMAYLPDWGFNGIGAMTAGQAYQIKVIGDQTLNYNSNDVSYKLSNQNVVDNSTVVETFHMNTGRNMHLLIPDYVWESNVSVDDEIYVYDVQGNKVGAAKITLPNTLITIWGDDLTTEEKDGLLDSELWKLVRYSAQEDKLIDIEFNSDDAQAFEQDALIIASGVNTVVKEQGLALFDCVPNPSSHTTEISFYSHRDQKLSLRLYNILGEELMLIKDDYFAEGYHKHQLNISKLAAGAYFYELRSGDKRLTKRLEVVK